MATRVWKGGAAAVAQLNTYTFANTWQVADVITVAYGTRTWTYALTNATISVFLPLLETAYNALDATAYPEYAEQTADSTASTLTLTADTAGRPFTATISTNSVAGTIDGAASSTGVVTTANAGPNVWGTAGNWSGATVPVTNDAVIIDDPQFSILYDLDQSAVTLTSLTVTARYAGSDNDSGGVIGLPFINEDSTAYPEYRDCYLKVGATTITVGDGQGDGSDRIKLNVGSVAGTLRVHKTGRGNEDVPALLFIGTSASNVLDVLGPSEVGVAMMGGEAANVAGGVTVGLGALLRLGAGVTTGALTNNGGGLEVQSAIVTSLTQLAGTTVILGTGAVAQLTIQGGNVVYNTSGTLNGATVVSGNGYLDFGQDSRSFTLTNPIDIHGQAAGVSDPLKRCTLIVDCNQGATIAQVNGGINARWTRGSVA